MRFRPCIDLRGGRVVQIVGGTLRDGDDGAAVTNFQTDRPAAEYARLYRQDDLRGGHVIALGPGNDHAARAALAAWPGGLQYGGGVTADNAPAWLEAGASHVIVTSWVFRDGRLDTGRLDALVDAVGARRLVLDLSCRRRAGAFWVVIDRWQTFTDVAVSAGTLGRLADRCDEFLVHGVDVEGRRAGIDADLVALLADAAPLPVTYAGGARSIADLDRVNELGGGRVDLTLGSALDIFGGDVPYHDVVAWHRAHA
ncbi:MAG: phosphoribosylformimino-5-aminoimidazole carboxamide ribotide isomerase [Planctomycetes bacterium]|nr:phosphoribosylformimino-5-aminoimidazole carboxamide ribotide isomerase [Planctomycetota bacterium]